MPAFIQSFGVDLNNNHLHIDNINTANLLASLFNQNIMEEPSSFVYNSQIKRVELHSDFDLHPQNSKIIAQQINWLLDFEEQFGRDDKDIFLVLYLKQFETITMQENDKVIVKSIFFNLDLKDYFGQTSSAFLKEKINQLL